MTTYPTRTSAADARFFRSLEAAASVSAACRRAGYTRAAVYRWRGADPAFAKRWAEAVTLAVDTLEAEADRRAKPYLVTMPKKPRRDRPAAPPTWRSSDALLLARLKALRPDLYRDPPPTPSAASEPLPPRVKVIDFLKPEGQARRETTGTPKWHT